MSLMSVNDLEQQSVLARLPEPETNPDSTAAESSRPIKPAARRSTRVGKIARLPDAVREELNQRLRDGESARHILPWLNALPEAQAVRQWYFDGKPVTEQNLSAWRHGGFAEWRRRTEQMERMRENAAWAAQLVEASGGNLTKGAFVLAITRLMEMISESGKTSAKEIAVLSQSLGKLMMVEVAQRRADQGQERVELSRMQTQAKVAMFNQQMLHRKCMQEAALARQRKTTVNLPPRPDAEAHPAMPEPAEAQVA